MRSFKKLALAQLKLVLRYTDGKPKVHSLRGEDPMATNQKQYHSRSNNITIMPIMRTEVLIRGIYLDLVLVLIASSRSIG